MVHSVRAKEHLRLRAFSLRDNSSNLGKGFQLFQLRSAQERRCLGDDERMLNPLKPLNPLIP